MGPDCYKDKSKFDEPWCQEKQWVLIGRYAGARFKLGDESECRIINDDEVIATILDPMIFLQYKENKWKKHYNKKTVEETEKKRVRLLN